MMRKPIKVLPGFPVTCAIKQAPTYLTNQSGPLRGAARLQVQLLDAHGLPATVPNVTENMPWPLCRPTLQLTAAGQSLVEVLPEGRQPEEAWQVDLSKSLLMLVMNISRAKLSLATWADYRKSIPCDLRMELYHALPPWQQEISWSRLDSHLIFNGSEFVESTAQPAHILPKQPILLKPATRPAAVRVVVGEQSDAELKEEGSGEDPFYRWQLLCDAGKPVNDLHIQV
jgi:hypothetical protein